MGPSLTGSLIDKGSDAPCAGASDAAVLIGSFQPFHNGHRASLLQALDTAPNCVVVIGSAFQRLIRSHGVNARE
jgi:cytidyltransferase-like protein